MVARADELWGELARRIDRVRDIVLHADDTVWRRACEAEGWSVGLVACHITLGLRRQAGWAERVAAGRAPHEFEWDRTHALNALVARRASAVSRGDVLASLDVASRRWRTLLERADDEILGRIVFRSAGHERDVAWLARALACRHVDEHLRSIEAAATSTLAP